MLSTPRTLKFLFVCLAVGIAGVSSARHARVQGGEGALDGVALLVLTSGAGEGCIGPCECGLPG